MTNPQQPGRPMTVNDVIHADERVVNLKKQFQEHQEDKNRLVLQLAYVEADIIKEMGAFEYLNNFTDTDEARLELSKRFPALTQQKAILIRGVSHKDKLMQECEESFKKLADSIVADLQKKVEEMRKQMEKASQSAPELPAVPTCSCESCPVTCGNDCPCNAPTEEPLPIEPPDDTVVGDIPGPEAN
jgi:hypothetical protein